MKKTIYQNLAGLAAIFSVAMFVAPSGAQAQNNFTPAGTDVQNTFTLNYDVGGVNQTQIDNTATPTSFTVDRRVQVNVAGVQNTNVAAAASNQSLFYGITNTGNDNHSYNLTAEEVAGEDFDTDATRSPRYSFFSYPDTNGDGILQAGEIAGLGTPYTFLDVAPDETIWIRLEANIPAGPIVGQTGDVILVAEAREPSAWLVTTGPTAAPTPTLGATLTADSDNNINTGVAENVFTDVAGPATTDGAADARHSGTATYTIIAANLSANKTVLVIATDGGDLATCASAAAPAGATEYAIPGACVEYLISVVNGAGAASADNIDIADVLPDEVEFAGSSQSGFSTAGTITNPAGGCTTGCTVSLDDAVLIPTPTVAATGELRIRALVR